MTSRYSYVGCHTHSHKVDPLKDLLLVLEAEKIEIEKLKAVGVRNAVATLEEVGLIENKGSLFCMLAHDNIHKYYDI